MSYHFAIGSRASRSASVLNVGDDPAHRQCVAGRPAADVECFRFSRPQVNRFNGTAARDDTDLLAVHVDELET